MERAFIRESPPYPRHRYLYLTNPEDAQKFYRTLDCLGIPYYTGRFLRANDIPNSQNIQNVLHWLRPVEVLNRLDPSHLEAINNIVHVEYAGIIEVDPDGTFLQFNPEFRQVESNL